MKEFQEPVVEVEMLEVDDVITTSSDIENMTPPN